MNLTELQQYMNRDLAILQKAFPLLQEEFPNGEWLAESTFDHDDCVGSFYIWFGFHVKRFDYLGEEFDGSVSVVIIDYHESRGETNECYSVETPDGADFYCPTIFDAIEFIGRMSRGLTPIDASAAALKARFGGES